MKSYYGIIEIGEIKNKQIESAANAVENAGFIGMNESNARFIHYPDCQQLLIWLTHPGREYSNARLKNNKTKRIVEEWPVTDRLNGSIQVVWDTVAIPPGDYTIEIAWKNGWQHQIDIRKLEEKVTPPVEQAGVSLKDAKQQEESPTEPIQYRDGFGKIIENEDMVLREKLNKGLALKFSRRIEYEGNLRAGTIIYSDGEHRIEFSHEMGGGNCMFYIDIPGEQQWEAATKTPLSARKEILEFVATTVQAQQASNCNYEIKTDTIGFYFK